MLRSSVFTIFVLFVTINSISGLEYGENLVNDSSVASKWVEAASEFDEIVFPQKKYIINFLNRTSALPLSHQCASSLTALSIGLQQKKFWAYQYLDSSGRGRSGLANGYIADLGDFDQCLNIREEDGQDFRGAYCLVNLKFPLTKRPDRAFLRTMKLNLRETELKDTIYEFYGNYTELFFYDTFTFAVCMPSTCTDADLTILLQHAFKNKELHTELHGSCTRYDGFVANVLGKPLSTQLSLLFLLALGSVVVVSTLITYFDLPGRKFAEIFCAIRNTYKLTADYKDPAMKKLMYFDSFKCFIQLGGSFGHICTFLAVVPVMFATISQGLDKDMENGLWLLSELLQKLIHMTQTILLISGFFTAYAMIPILEKSAGRLSFASYAAKRWLRTAPSTIIAILLLFAVSAISYGPLAEDLEKTFLETCRKSWLLTVLQINNFAPTTETCLPQAWTQSVDFHLWLLAFYPLKLLATNPRRGVTLCLSLIGIGIVIPMLVTYYSELPAPIGSTRILEIIFLIIRGESFPTMLFHTYNCVSNYFIGVLLGYICYKEVKIRFEYAVAVSVVGVGFFACCIYGPYIWLHFLGQEFSAVGNAVYTAVLKSSFGFLCACNIYFVYFYLDYFPFNEVARSKLLTVFGRLSLSIYISQLAPVSYYMVMSYDPIPVNKYLLIIRILSIVVQCCMMGYFTFLIVEAPFMNMTKELGFKASGSRQELSPEGETSSQLVTKQKTT